LRAIITPNPTDFTYSIPPAANVVDLYEADRWEHNLIN